MTCEKYIDRTNNSLSTWLNNVKDDSDYIFVSSISGNKKVGYNTPDDYNNTPLKWWYFIKNYDFNNFDWIFFIDDDIYCFVNKLQNLVKNYDPNENIAIGEKLTAKTDMYHFFRSCDLIHYPVDFFAGGGGYVVSNKCISLIKDFVKSHENPVWSFHGDVSFGHWMKMVNTELINKKELFGSQHFSDISFKDDIGYPNPNIDKITYHYCKEEDMLKLYNEYEV
jgi:hypothetical protein